MCAWVRVCTYIDVPIHDHLGLSQVGQTGSTARPPLFAPMSVDMAGPAMAPPPPTHTVLWQELFADPDGAGARPNMPPPMCETLSLLARRPRRDERPFEWVDDPFQQLLLEHASHLSVKAACLHERRWSAEGTALCGEPQEGALSPPQSPRGAVLLEHMSQLSREEVRLQERKHLAAALFAECVGKEGLLSPPRSPRGDADRDHTDVLPRWATDRCHAKPQAEVNEPPPMGGTPSSPC